MLIVSFVYAQTTAVTLKGKMVILYENGKWEYDQDANKSLSKLQQEKNTSKIEIPDSALKKLFIADHGFKKNSYEDHHYDMQKYMVHIFNMSKWKINELTIGVGVYKFVYNQEKADEYLKEMEVKSEKGVELMDYITSDSSIFNPFEFLAATYAEDTEIERALRAVKSKAFKEDANVTTVQGYLDKNSIAVDAELLSTRVFIDQSFENFSGAPIAISEYSAYLPSEVPGLVYIPFVISAYGNPY